MHAGDEILRHADRLVRRKAEEAFEIGIELEEFARTRVPAEGAGLRRGERDLQLLLLLAQCLFGALALGDIGQRAGKGQRCPVRVVGHVAAGDYPAEAVIAAGDTVFGFVRLAGGDRGGDEPLDARAIVRMDHCHIDGQRQAGGGLLRIETKELGQECVGLEHVARDIPEPRPDKARGQRAFQPLFALLDGVAGQHLIGHDEGDDHHPRDGARGVARRLVDKREVLVREAPLPGAVELHTQLGPVVCLAGGIDAVEELLDALASHLRQGVEDRLADHVTGGAAPDLQGGRIGQLDDVLGAAQEHHRRRGLQKQIVETAPLGLGGRPSRPRTAGACGPRVVRQRPAWPRAPAHSPRCGRHARPFCLLAHCAPTVLGRADSLRRHMTSARRDSQDACPVRGKRDGGVLSRQVAVRLPDRRPRDPLRHPRPSGRPTPTPSLSLASALLPDQPAASHPPAKPSALPAGRTTRHEIPRAAAQTRYPLSCGWCGRMDAANGTTTTDQERARGLRRLKWLAVLAPLVFLGAIEAIRFALLPGFAGSSAGYALYGGALLVGTLSFAEAIFGVIGRMQARITQRNRELLALHEAGLAITGERDLEAVLQLVVDEARELVGARYGALSLLGAGGIEALLTSGLSAEDRERMGPLPVGHGLLGAMLSDGGPLRLADLGQDPRSVGFPPGHPVMRSLLAVPIVSHGQVVGNLYLTECEGAAEFSADDEETLARFATQAALAIEN